jgi:hypothetical protein
MEKSPIGLEKKYEDGQKDKQTNTFSHYELIWILVDECTF